MANLLKRFVISDHHLGHENIISFEHGGKPLRDFRSLDQMHDAIIKGHNSVVTDEDTVYFLGDVVMNWKKGGHVLEVLKGRKILVRGNHDLEDAKKYLQFFADVRGIEVIPHTAVLTHVPVHPLCLDRPSWPRNIHGHLHRNIVPKDRRYINACVEMLDYIPRRVEELILDTP